MLSALASTSIIDLTPGLTFHVLAHVIPSTFANICVSILRNNRTIVHSNILLCFSFSSISPFTLPEKREMFNQLTGSSRTHNFVVTASNTWQSLINYVVAWQPVREFNSWGEIVSQASSLIPFKPNENCIISALFISLAFGDVREKRSCALLVLLFWHHARITPKRLLFSFLTTTEAVIVGDWQEKKFSLIYAFHC